MSETFQPQVNVKQPDGTFKWTDCTDSTGKPPEIVAQLKEFLAC